MTTDELTKLADKYQTLGDLRRARARGEQPPPAHVFKALARAFPGALRELDTLPLDVLDARRDALRAAANGAPIEPWMEWTWDYHHEVRALLAARERGQGRLNDRAFAALERKHHVPAKRIAEAIFLRVRP